MCTLLVDDSSEHKKVKEVNENVFATVSHNKYKGSFLNNKHLKHSMNRIQSKNHRAGTYETKKIYLTCFNNKIHVLNNGFGGLSRSYQNLLYKKQFS